MTKTAYQRKGGLPPPGSKKPRPPIKDAPNYDRIVYRLATGESVRRIAKDTGHHETSLYNLRKKLPPQLKAAFIGNFLKPGVDLEKLKTEESQGWLQSMATQRARLLIMQDKAIEDDNPQAVATLAGRIQENLRIVAQYLGELHQHSTKTVQHVLMTPEYLQLRAALIKALGPFPEARAAISAAFQKAEAIGVARTIDVTPALPAPAHADQ